MALIQSFLYANEILKFRTFSVSLNVTFFKFRILSQSNKTQISQTTRNVPFCFQENEENLNASFLRL